jgi:thiamine-phosphate pyrophosphorylase
MEGVPLLCRQAEGAVAAGVDFLQVRERDLDARALAALVRAIVAVARGSRTRVMVNDRIDVAMATGAAGVHLRSDSPPPARVRRLCGGRILLGRSVHEPIDVAASPGSDVFVAGAVFSTPSKEAGSTLLGLDGLGRVVQAAGHVPVLAIGGMSESVSRAVARTGAAGMASIGAFLPARPGDDPALSVQDRANSLRLAFDSPDRVPYDG